MHVDETGCDVRVARIDDFLGIFLGKQLADLRNDAVARADIQYRVDPRGGIDDSAARDEDARPPAPARR